MSLVAFFEPERDAAHPPPHAATLALTAGVPVDIVAARLGDDPRTVLSTYAHLVEQRQQNVEVPL